MESATPGGVVALLGVGREGNGFVTFVRRFSSHLEDFDRDGAVREAVGWSAETASVWAAVDVATGQIALASPPGQVLDEQPAETSTLSALGMVELRGRVLDLVLVRSGVNAWRASIADGGADDLDGEQNTVLTLGHGVFASGDGEPPGRLDRGDRLIVIDPDRLSVRIVTLETLSATGGEGEAIR